MPVIIVLVGASGTGKTSIAGRLHGGKYGWFHDITTTTRPPRDGEVDGVDYHFTDNGGFMARLAAGEFCETVEQWGYKYGSPAPKDGQDLVVVLDTAGALAYKNLFGNNVLTVGLICQETTRLGRISGERSHRTEVSCADLLSVCDLVLNTTCVSVDNLADTIDSLARGWRRTD